MSTTTITTYEGAIEALETILTEGGLTKTKVKQAINKLKGAGGATLASLRECERDDFEAFDFPRLCAKQAAKLFESASASGPTPAAPGTMVIETHRDSLQKLSHEALLKQYSIGNPGAVGEELSARSQNRPFLVYTDAGATKLNVAASAERLQAHIDRVPVTEYVMVDGEPILPLCVGERPVVRLAENCLFHGRALLMPGHVCDVTNSSWEGVSQDVQRFLAFAVKCGALRFADLGSETTASAVRGIIATAKSETGLATFKQRYPGVTNEFRKLPPNEWPSLLIDPRVSAAPVGGGARPPFAGSAAPAWAPDKIRIVLLGPGEDAIIGDLNSHLMALCSPRCNGPATLWTPALVPPGDNPTTALESRLGSADIVIVLAGPSTPYELVQDLYERSMRGLMVVPVLCRAFDTTTHPLARLVWLPRSGNALLSPRNDRDEALSAIVREIRMMIEKIQQQRVTPPPPAPAPAAIKLGRLSGPDRKELREALISAFPARSSLSRMVDEHMDIRLDAICGQGNLVDTCFQLIERTEARGCTGQLVAAAVAENPGNRALQAFVRRFQATAPDHNEIAGAIESAGLTNNRRALLSGIHSALVSGLHNGASPQDQIRMDIDALKGMGQLRDGSTPWTTWLANAVALSGPRKEADVFLRALDAARGV